MRVILNSDILYNPRLETNRLHSKLQDLCDFCAKRGHTIVIPLTTLLEFNRAQNQLVIQESARIQDAYKILEEYKIPHTQVPPSDLVKAPDLLALCQALGPKVLLENPTPDDLREAHTRACMHSSPTPPDSKSDEMRDLVIWIMSLRIARDDAGALLISRDTVHSHTRGDDEATSSALLRFQNIDDAMEYLDVQKVTTPGARLILKMLSPAWKDLLSAELPVLPQIALAGVMNETFVQGTNGPSFASCAIELPTTDGRKLSANAEIHATDGVVTNVDLSRIRIDGHPWKTEHLSVIPNARFEIADDYTERLRALRTYIQGEP